MFTSKLAALAVVAISASVVVDAEIILFWSTTGISNLGMVYNTALTNFKPYMFPPTRAAELEAGTYDLFLWLEYVVDPNLPLWTQLYGLNMRFEGDATHAQNIAFRHRADVGACQHWQNSTGIPLDGIMYVITIRGIEFVPPPETSCNLYYPTTQEALIGAARITGTPGQTKVMAIEDIALRLIGGEDLPDPLVVPAVVRFYALGDLDGDNAVTFDDIDPLVFALTHTEAEFRAAYPDGHYWAADCDHDHDVDFDDINPFVALLSG